MGWAVGFDSNWNRDIGYGVPAYCDHPGCMAEIDRGLSYVCGGKPYGGEEGCGLYFCEKHQYASDSDTFTVVCSRCRNKKSPFKPTPEHPKWIQHKATDESWAEWRKDNSMP